MVIGQYKYTSNICLNTHVGRKEDQMYTHLMSIEDIESKISSAKPGEYIQSGMLKSGNSEIQLKIYPNGQFKETTGKVGMDVDINNIGIGKDIKIEYLVAENPNGFFLKTKDIQKKIKNVECHCIVRLQNIMKHSEVKAFTNSSFFPMGVLTVKVNIKIQGEETVTVNTMELPSITATQLKGELSGHFRNMFENRQFTDFRIICQGEVIPCHRNVLAVRSEIFQGMLNHNMKEIELGEVVIDDFDLETIRAIVLFIYTGDVEHKEENAEQLMRAADKYRLESLKNMIEGVLIKSVKIENAIDMFVLGDAVHARSLREVSKDVIVRNAAAIVNIDGWKEALGRFQELTWEIFESLAKRNPNKK